ncbi:type II secretion system F family protein [Candidatus Aerophobetes bacterium]|nr:type II secretion system F family protein [Candidatus Aerophobetes bacterium]
MAAYSYLALDTEGRRVRGVIEADNESEAVAQLRPQGLMVISIRESRIAASGKNKKGSQLSIFQPRIKGKDVIVLSRQFATLINAGVPLAQALSILIEQTQNTSLKKVIEEVRRDVEGGMPLSSALAKHPKIFSRLYCDMVRAGEVGGVLDVILTRLANYLESTENINQRMKSAMRYPLFVLFMAGGLVSALLFFILPKMKELFAETLHANLPGLTQFMLDLSNFARQKYYFVIIFIIALAIGYHFFKNSNRGSYLLDKMKLKIPVLGKLYHRISLSRFSRTLATLSNSGVPILESLEITGKTAGNKLIEKAVEEARISLKEGETIATPLSRYEVFPPMMVSMISVGEETGALDEMLNKVADFYDREVETMVDSLTSLIEPLLIVFLGATVGIVVIAMYLPYFTMFKHIG